MQLQPKSNEEIADKIEELYQSGKYDAEFRKKLIMNTLAQKDAEVAVAVKEERSRIEIELMSAEKHSHPGEPGLFLQWSDLKKALTPKE